MLTVKILVNLFVNGQLLGIGNYGNFVEDLGQNLASSNFWQHLGMESSLFLEDKSTIRLDLFSEGTEILDNELREINGYLPDSISFLRELTLGISFNTESTSLSTEKLRYSFNYSMVTLFLNLEQRMPFAFSVYGRQLFRNNYRWSSRNINLMIQQETSVQLNEHKVSLCRAHFQILCTLELKMVSEYNTLKIMQECNESKTRFNSCKKSRLRLSGGDPGPYKPNVSIKSAVYDLNFFYQQDNKEGHD